MKNKKGITLLSLIVTVIIMIILASVTIRIITSGGIIDKTREAKDLYEKEEIYETIISKIEFTDSYNIDVLETYRKVKDELKVKEITLISPESEEEITNYAIIQVKEKDNNEYIYKITTNQILKDDDKPLPESFEECTFVKAIKEIVKEADGTPQEIQMYQTIIDRITPKIDLAKYEKQMKEKYKNSPNIIVSKRLDYSQFNNLMDFSTETLEKIYDYNYEEIKQIEKLVDWILEGKGLGLSKDEAWVEMKKIVTDEKIQYELLENGENDFVNIAVDKNLYFLVGMLFGNNVHSLLPCYTLVIQEIQDDGTVLEHGINHQGEEYDRVVPAYLGIYYAPSNNEKVYCTLELKEDGTGYIEYNDYNVTQEVSSNLTYTYDNGKINMIYENSNVSSLLKDAVWDFEIKDKCKILSFTIEDDSEPCMLMSNAGINKEGTYTVEVPASILKIEADGNVTLTVELKNGFMNVYYEDEPVIGDPQYYYTIGNKLYTKDSNTEELDSVLTSIYWGEIDDSTKTIKVNPERFKF